jgi:hypothetical protein
MIDSAGGSVTTIDSEVVDGTLTESPPAGEEQGGCDEGDRK